MITFESLDLDTCELAWAIWAAGDAETLDGAAALAADIQSTLVEYTQEWELDSYEWELALQLA